MSAPISKQQFISLKDLKNDGFSQYRINQMVAEGKLNRITRKYYENLKYDGEINDFSAVPAYTNDRGVVCLLSAAVYYHLTLQRPPHIYVALPRASRMPDPPAWPQMQFYLFSGTRYGTGVREIREGANAFSIYDKEKTVCDVIFYRNKLGLEPAAEVMRNYMSASDRDLNRLMHYAEELRVKTAIRQFAEVLM